MNIAKKEIDATSKHKASPCYEWSKQVSRDVHPFFVPAQTQNQRGSYNSEKPRRHMMEITMDRQGGRGLDKIREDKREYEPKVYEELHPKCSVSIGKSMRGKSIFSGTAEHHNTELHPYPSDDGWGHGKRSVLSRAPKPKDAIDKLREEAERYRTEHGVEPPPVKESSMFVESKIRNPAGGKFLHGEARPLPPAPDRPQLKVNYKSIEAERFNVSFNKGTGRAAKEKPSSKYNALFRVEPPPPLYSSDRRRMTSGFAPMRSSSSMSVSDLLATASADVTRARSVMDSNFGNRSRSALRDSMLYTPQPDDM